MQDALDNRMTWEQKLGALQCIADTSLRMRHPGDWYVNSSMEIGGDEFLRGVYGNGSAPESAVNDHWRQYCDELPPDRYVVTSENGRRRHWRWNKYMWSDLTPAQLCITCGAAVTQAGFQTCGSSRYDLCGRIK